MTTRWYNTRKLKTGGIDGILPPESGDYLKRRGREWDVLPGMDVGGGYRGMSAYCVVQDVPQAMLIDGEYGKAWEE